MSNYRKQGSIGEECAAGLLEDKGFEILERNYKTKFAEIDIVAKKNACIHFIEVKLRCGSEYGHPAEAVSAAKQKRIRCAAEIFLLENHLLNAYCSFDVFELEYDFIEACF